MPRLNHSFTVEFRGRRKTTSLSWADLMPKEVAAPPIREEKNSQSSPPANAAIDVEERPKGRILPSLVSEFKSVSTASETPPKPARTRKKRIQPRSPQRGGPTDVTVLEIDMTPEAVSAPVPESKQADRDRVARSRNQWHRRSRSTASLPRSEKWKRRLPTILR
ncbi:MAG: hypothetical protein K0S56_864 [Microvirga sp.]|nr:hypothetical protein [Microvirga sp.]